MHCDECKLSLSEFMDNELAPGEAESVRVHLAVCDDCSSMCAELAAMVETSRLELADMPEPPNSPAMWRRIANVIETEAAQKPEQPVVKKRFWHLSLPQLAAAVVAIAVISSLVTVVGIRNYSQPSADDLTSRTAATQTTFEKVLSKFGLIDTPQAARDRRLKEQQATIDYWASRVQMRRSQWNGRTREAFDRNMRVIDQSLVQYTELLQQDPDDELSSEMLDAVMNDKMNLLRDFSDL